MGVTDCKTSMTEKPLNDDKVDVTICEIIIFWFVWRHKLQVEGEIFMEHNCTTIPINITEIKTAPSCVNMTKVWLVFVFFLGNSTRDVCLHNFLVYAKLFLPKPERLSWITRNFSSECLWENVGSWPSLLERCELQVRVKCPPIYILTNSLFIPLKAT